MALFRLPTPAEVERILGDRITRLLNRLGVPSNDDLQYLERQVEELEARVDGLLKTGMAGASGDGEAAPGLPPPKR